MPNNNWSVECIVKMDCGLLWAFANAQISFCGLQNYFWPLRIGFARKLNELH